MRFIKQYSRWILAVFIAFVFVQSLFFKFSGSNETNYIFTTLGDWSGFDWFAQYGAYGVGISELIASIILMTPFWAFGAIAALGIMTGAIYFHLFTPLGIAMPVFDAAGNVVGDDAGTLFAMACLTWLCALGLVIKDLRSEKRLLVLPLQG